MMEISPKKKIVGIIQARMGASRLPAKMLLDLHGKPLIEWVLRRVSKSRFLDAVVVAVPDTKDNEILSRFLSGVGANIFRGSENDVVKRFYDASMSYDATDLVRICADNPLVSPKQIDALIDYYKKNPCDYAYNHIPRNNSFPDGLGAEIAPLLTLEKINREARSPSQREHVFNYIWDNPSQFDIKTFDPEDSYLARPDMKLDIDTIEDYRHFTQRKIRIDMDDCEIIKACGGVE
jgi:spore coat polysaccharide biosynthesis protein SpsF